ncbi:MAG: PP2C family protein-serine/threonine phosphatase [Acidobacteriaceae bacterium]
MPGHFQRPSISATLPYFALGVVAFVLLTIYGYNAYSFVSFMQHGQHWSSAPFVLDPSDQIIDYPKPEAQAVHLRKGDRILSLDGRPYTNSRQLADLMQTSRPGTPLDVVVQHSDHSRADVSVPLVALTRGKPGAGMWATIGFLRLVFPFLCLALGFWVVMAKPRDRNAWFLLGIFAFFNVLFKSPGSPAIHFFWIRWIVNFGSVTCLTSAFACIMLFGLYFPDRSRLDRRRPWLKWCLLAPLSVLLLLNWYATYDRSFDFDHRQLVTGWIEAVAYATEVLGAACIFVFFTRIAYSLRTAQTADARRRLRVLYVGSAIGLGGLLVLFILASISGGELERLLPLWLVFIVAVIPLLFPATLAYVVVVQRAMDVRILLRQGTKYAFARGTLWFLQFVFIAAIAYRLARLLHEPRVSRKDVLVLLVLGLIFVALRARVARAISTWLDRRFFRESYSTDQLLSELARQVQTFTETRPLLETVTEQIGRTLHIERIAVFLHSGQHYRLQQAVGFSPSEALSLSANSTAIRYMQHSKSPLTLYEDGPDGWLALASAPERETLRQLSAELLLPLRGRTEMMGVLALGPKRSEEPYSRTDIQLLQSVSAQTGLAIENAGLLAKLGKEAAQRERMSREIEIAREVQERLFPQCVPELPDGSCAGHCRPALGVGGDYYDFISLASGKIGIAVGDVSGKGISAALVMASLRASLHGITMSASPQSSLNLATLVQNINRLVHDSSTPSRYATFFFGEYDPVSHLLRYVNAGHNPPVVARPLAHAPSAGRRTDFEILRLDVGGTVVGLLDNPEYEVGSIVLRPSDVLVAFTDGISEAMNAAEEEWGEERMIEAICACGGLPATAVVDRIFSAADAFTRGAPQHDDMTLAVLVKEPA